MEIRRLKDSGVTVGAPHDELTALTNRCLNKLDSSELGYALKGKDVIILIRDPKTNQNGIGCAVHGENDHWIFANLAVQLATSLGQLGKLVPGLRQLIRDAVTKHLVDG